jgi:DNA repair protein RecN (Recombination protein N)
MLRSLALRDFVIVRTLDVEFTAGFGVLTGETGAGKSILVDALQLALGARGDAVVVREGASRTDITACFDMPASLREWLDEGGFGTDDDAGDLLLRRTIDAQGKSRAWINGASATVTQLREAADHLVDIHGQHAWQSLTRAAAVRTLIDEHAGASTAALSRTWSDWQAAQRTLELATSKLGELERERERLQWVLGEVDKLAPQAGEWSELEDEHKRLSNAQALIDAAQRAADAVTESEPGALGLTHHAVDAIERVVDVDARLQGPLDVLRGAHAQLADAAHSLRAYLQHADLDPQRLAALDARLAAWMSLARRHKVAPAELANQREQWHASLRALDASSDVDALHASVAQARERYMTEARAVSKLRAKAAPGFAAAVTAVMQDLGMAGGRLEVALEVQPQPQAFGLESAQLLVAGHAGATPRPIAKVASGGELSRLALAIAVTSCTRVASAGAQRSGSGSARGAQAGTLIFDEIDAGVGGTVADTVGRLMKRLGRERQVLAVTHLAQVAACADCHFVVTKAAEHAGPTEVVSSRVQPVRGDARVHEIARMVGGKNLQTAVAHARQLVDTAQADAARPSGPRRPGDARSRAAASTKSTPRAASVHDPSVSRSGHLDRHGTDHASCPSPASAAPTTHAPSANRAFIEPKAHARAAPRPRWTARLSRWW